MPDVHPVQLWDCRPLPRHAPPQLLEETRLGLVELVNSQNPPAFVLRRFQPLPLLDYWRGRDSAQNASIEPPDVLWQVFSPETV